MRQKTAVTRKKGKITVAKVLGIVKWYNVIQNYGFITRCDNQEDIFVHRTVIKKNNSEKYIPNLGDREVVEFKIVQGRKGLQTAEVTGPDGVSVKAVYMLKIVVMLDSISIIDSPYSLPFLIPPFSFTLYPITPSIFPIHFFTHGFPHKTMPMAAVSPKIPFQC